MIKNRKTVKSKIIKKKLSEMIDNEIEICEKNKIRIFGETEKSAHTHKFCDDCKPKYYNKALTLIDY